MRIAAVVLLVVAPIVAFGQTFDAAVTGMSGGCLPITPFIYPTITWLGTAAQQGQQTDIVAVAQAPGGRIYGLVTAGPHGRNFFVAAVGPDGSRTPVTVTVPNAVPFALVVDRAGTVYVIYAPFGGGRTNDHLIVFAPDGSIRADYPLGGNYAYTGVSTAMDLAGDQCTLFLALNGTLIRRFNACTGTFGADFATVSTPHVRGLRVLPDGGLLVSSGTFSPGSFAIYSPAGTLVTSYPLPEAIAALTLTDGGSRVRFADGDCDEPYVATMDLATGTVLSTVVMEDPEGPSTIAAARGWTAALGHTHGHEIPTAGTAALAVIAMMLTSAALLRLR